MRSACKKPLSTYFTIAQKPFTASALTFNLPADLSIENNPLECNCATAKWIQNLVNQKRNILGPYWADVTCLPEKDGKIKHSLANLTMNTCCKCLYVGDSLLLISNCFCS